MVEIDPGLGVCVHVFIKDRCLCIIFKEKKEKVSL